MIFIQLPFPIDPSNLDNLDPLFVDPDNGDYHLQVGSPVINMGDNKAPELPEKDKDGNPRMMDGVVGLGAFEFRGRVGFPDIEIDPLTLRFRRVKLGRSRTKSCQIKNGGDADLVVEAIDVTPVPSLKLEGPQPPFTVASGEEVKVELSFAPIQKGKVQGRSIIQSNDLDEGKVEVRLEGKARR